MLKRPKATQPIRGGVFRFALLPNSSSGATLTQPEYLELFLLEISSDSHEIVIESAAP